MTHYEAKRRSYKLPNLFTLVKLLKEKNEKTGNHKNLELIFPKTKLNIQQRGEAELSTTCDTAIRE